MIKKAAFQIILLLFLMGLLPSFLEAAPASLNGSKEEQKLLEEAFQSLQTRDYSAQENALPFQRKQKAQQAAKSFADKLDRLGKILKEKRAQEIQPLEGENFYAKIAAIAWERRKSPENFAVIEKVYIHGVHQPDAIFPHAPLLQPEHVQEKYRRAWEYCILAPEPAGASPLYRSRCYEAVARIGQESSLVTLVEAYRISSQPGAAAELAANEQREILGALAWFPTEKGLRAILECLELPSSWDVQDFVRRILTDQEYVGNGKQWKEVLAHFSSEGLTPRQRDVLNKAKS